MLIAMSAFIAPIVSRRFGIPAAVGEILFGVGLGVSGLMASSEFVNFLAQLGLIILMFTAGYEIDFEVMEKEGKRALVPALSFTILVFGLSGLITWLMGLGVFHFLVISAISIGLGAAFLKESGLSQTKAGQAFLLAGSGGEFLTVVILTFLLFYHEFGPSLRMLYQLAGLGVMFLAAYAVLMSLRSLVWWFPEKFLRLAEAHDSSEIGVRAGFALAFMFVGIAAFFGIEPLLGAFIAGALFGFVFRDKSALEPRFSAVGYGFLIPVFFISVGVNFDLVGMIKQGPTVSFVLSLVGAVLISRLIASPVLMFRKIGIREALGVGMLMAAPLSLQVVIAEVAVRAGAMNHGDFGVVVLVAMILGLLAPASARFLIKPGTSQPDKGSKF